ncbi:MULTISPECIES: hypothetical protein [Aneurinibacillus]|uniref:Uncharacterized protein n=1 Tax=Aneurinibacillus thermoaerophilus TaxID=143495 RepID=A0A1G7ZEE5_ANETH|nr:MULTISPECIES: hypothetical protein [Aneurinibacillus]MED0676575.1 hypothetical protein [Aneurinibacillus thermoaerophilus]MED0735926.1 hypothetical protein [Aneurinibacillus thermoaerophilus]MED0757118.1 hypothetical protein [Aneurinibacillus thermoaerophilus]MED0759361.1 hypothetical protein [Aneurinibacillus thermoaerophilus]QYY41210.1 hypothetical protein K3F53_09590 [Aneurinibacillus thermoaerophilus]
MSTIKRWTDEGYLEEVIDERERFWALKLKQGKKTQPLLRVHRFFFFV